MGLSAVVVGSSTSDIIIKVPRLPSRGETVLGQDYVLAGGGKGANQAIALSRLGVSVTFITRVGDDHFGRSALQLYENEGLNLTYITQEPNTPSAIAVVIVDADGDNLICVAPGANMHLTAESVRSARTAFKKSKILLTQLAVSIEAVNEAILLGRQYGLTVILNPAPARRIPKEVMEGVDILTPNMSELSFFTGHPVSDLATAEEASHKLLQAGPKTIITTLGYLGALLVTKKESIHFPAPSVIAVDETGAGDAFNAGLVAGIAANKTLSDSIKYGCLVGALATTKLGAQTALPYSFEVDEFFSLLQNKQEMC